MKTLSKVLAVIFFSLFADLALAAPLDINQANAEQIAEAMVGVGQAKAEAIVKDREANGKFKSVADLTRVKGIGPALVEKNRDKVVTN